MKKLMRVLIATSFGLCLGSAMAATTGSGHVGVINVQEVMKSSPKLVQKLEALKKQFKEKDEELLALQKQIETDNQKLNRDGPTLGDGARERLEDKIQKEAAMLQLKQKQFRREVAKKQQDEMRDVLEQMKKAVYQVAEKNNLDLVLQREGLPFANKRLDITDEVKKALSS